MTSENEALARRAVACKRWRWMDAMRGFYNGKAFRIAEVDLRHPSCPGGNAVIHWQGEVNSACHSTAGRDGLLNAALPDFSDAATRGCLLQLVREAWGDPEACAIASGFAGWRVLPGFRVPAYDWHPRTYHPTEEAALVAALVAAPEAAP